MKRKIDFSVIIPAFNEEDSIGRAIRTTSRVLSKGRFNSEIIVVNDGSTDRTGKICREMKKKFSFIFVDKPKNEGYAHAIKTGLQYSTGEYVCYLDADLQYSPTDMVNMYKKAKKNGYQIIIGIHKTKNYMMSKKIRSFIYNYFFIIPLFRLRISDINALKILKKDALDKIKLKGSTWVIDTELVIKFKKMGYRIHTFPITLELRKEGVSKTNLISIIKTTFQILLLRLDTL